MQLLERIKAAIFGVDPPPRRTADRAREDQWLRSADVSTPANDPVLDDIAASGVQPTGKPAAIAAAQNPKRSPRTFDR